MSANNGEKLNIIRIKRKGLRHFEFGDPAEDPPEKCSGPFQIDVVAEQNQLSELFSASQTDAGKLSVPEWNRIQWKWVQDLVQREVGRAVVLTQAEALEFIKVLNEETEKLADFFSPKRATAPSSPDSSTTLTAIV